MQCDDNTVQKGLLILQTHYSKTSRTLIHQKTSNIPEEPALALRNQDEEANVNNT